MADVNNSMLELTGENSFQHWKSTDLFCFIFSVFVRVSIFPVPQFRPLHFWFSEIFLEGKKKWKSTGICSLDKSLAYEPNSEIWTMGPYPLCFGPIFLPLIPLICYGMIAPPPFGFGMTPFEWPEYFLLGSVSAVWCPKIRK